MRAPRRDVPRRRLRDALDTVDLYFLGLRVLVAAAGAFWLVWIPLGEEPRRAALKAFAGYILSSGLLYAAILARPAWIRRLYLAAVLVDTGLVFCLVRFVGENRGSYFVMFYLLIGVSSYYFGRVAGLGIASLATVLYAQIYLADHRPDLYSWPDFLFRVGFFLLTALSLGLLSERESRVKARIEELNEELARKNAILEQAYRFLSLGRLSAGLAESINNPTGVLVVRLELLLEEARRLGLSQAMIDDLEVAAKHARRVATVANRLLAFSKREAHEPRLLSLNEIVEDAIVLMESEFERRRITVRKQLAGDLPLLRGDRNGLGELMLNTLSNALDALQEGGTIRITTRSDGRPRGVIECSVSDDGVGILPEDLERIFEPFFTTKKGGSGVGLGLSSSLRIMKQHGGLIRVESEPSKGATFTMTFPAHGA